MGQKIKAKEIETSGVGLKPDLLNSLKDLSNFKDNYENPSADIITVDDTNLNYTAGNLQEVAENAQVNLKYALIRDEKPAGTEGGTFTSGAWRTRDLNTIVDDEIGITLNNNQFILPKGKYILKAKAPAIGVSYHIIKIKNITDNSDYIGTIQYASENVSMTNVSFVEKINLVINEYKTFEIQHICDITNSSFGFGSGNFNSGVKQIFTEVKIIKVGE